MRMWLVACMEGPPSVPDRSFCDIGARATLWPRLLARGPPHEPATLAGALATLWRVHTCLGRVLARRSARMAGAASLDDVTPERTAGAEPDLATPARRLVPQGALGRALASSSRVSTPRRPSTRPAVLHSPSTWRRHAGGTPCRAAATARAGMCKQSTGGSVLSLGRSVGAMALAGQSRVRREKSRPADLMYRGGSDGRMERSQRYVTDVTDVPAGLPARHHRGMSPTGQAGPWGRLGEAYGGIE
jgi:hypothetical protein